jgi:nascent polypeptide-associated complex subunit alpha
MFPGMNSKQMKSAMQRMGMRQEELEATRVIVEFQDKQWVFDDPSFSKLDMMGSASFQLSGEYRESAIDSTPDINQDDIETVMEQASVSEDVAKKAIVAAKGDLAEAILSLQEE